MTVLELVNILKSTGYPVAYYQFKNTKKSPAPDPPFICYVFPDTENFHADDTVYHDIQDVDIELYTDIKDFEAEKRIEDLLKANDIPFEKVESYIEKEKFFQILYEVRLI